VKRKRTITSELVDHLTAEEKNESLIVHQQQSGSSERKEHLNNWLKRFGYTLQDIDPASHEIRLTKTDPQFKVTVKLDMETRRLVETEKDPEEDEGDEAEEQAEASEGEGEEEEEAQKGEGEGEDEEGEGADAPYFEEKDVEVWVENKKGEVMVINGDLMQNGLELWNVAIYPNAQSVIAKERSNVHFDVRKVDQAGYDHWKTFLRGFGIEDEFILVSDVLCEMYDEKTYNLWLKKAKEFLLA